MKKLCLALALTALPFAPLSAQEEVTTTHEGLSGDLSGTLLGTPSADSPSILIIAGSGPTDRNGNNPIGVTASSYRLLAEALADEGIATIRFDKRGMFASAGAVPNANDVTVDRYVDDVEAWTSTMLERSGGECIWLLGHSEGGLIAMAAAARDASRYCGLMLVATPGRNLAEVVRAQIAANPAATFLLPQVDDISARLTAGESVSAEEIHPGLLPLFGPQVQGFISSLFQQDPEKLLQAHTLPVLILNGGKDIQTPSSDAEMLAVARSDLQLVILPDVNHALKLVEGDDRASNLATYSDPDLPLAPGVVDAITTFLRE